MQQIAILCGPTAIGKSELAVSLALQFDMEIVSADSSQIWRGLNIGTAKPSLKLRKKVPHHLIDIIHPSETFDAFQYIKLANRAIQEILSKGKKVLVVGGAGMYLQSLVWGLNESPGRDEVIRRNLKERVALEGVNILHQELEKVDPMTAKQVHPNDTTRIIRALEVWQLTGQSLSTFYKEHQKQTVHYDALQVGLNCDRNCLYQRINNRVDAMLAEGWLQEVEALMQTYPADLQSLYSLGYRELMAFLKNEIEWDGAVETIKQKTRNFAKRQLTWFRANKAIVWFQPEQESEIAKVIETFYERLG